eukprot:7125892-Prymnesium_polylepis.1
MLVRRGGEAPIRAERARVLPCTDPHGVRRADDHLLQRAQYMHLSPRGSGQARLSTLNKLHGTRTLLRVHVLCAVEPAGYGMLIIGPSRMLRPSVCPHARLGEPRVDIVSRQLCLDWVGRGS